MTDIRKHLKERHLNTDLYPTIGINDEEQMVTFPLYNLSYEMVGYQTYNPNAPKIRGNSDPKTQKYWNYVSGDKRKHKKLAVWGLETYRWTDKTLFVVEGIFDAVRLHNLNLPCIATLCNHPLHLKSWLRTLNVELVAICDGDSAGKKLRSISDEYVLLPEGKDLGDMTDEEVKYFMKGYLK